MLTPSRSGRHYALLALAFILVEAMLMLFVDQPLSLYLRSVDNDNETLIDFFRSYTDFGLSAWYLWPSGIGALICLSLSSWRQIPLARREKLRRAGWMFAFFFVSVALAGIITDMLKALIGRARPVLLDREDFYGFIPFATHNNYKSLPSGHATTAFAVAVCAYRPVPAGTLLVNLICARYRPQPGHGKCPLPFRCPGGCRGRHFNRFGGTATV